MLSNPAAEPDDDDRTLFPCLIIPGIATSMECQTPVGMVSIPSNQAGRCVPALMTGTMRASGRTG